MTVELAPRAALVIAALVVAGCTDPYAKERARKPGDGQGATRPVATAAPSTQASASTAASAFATRWVNWDWRSVAAQQRELARLATGSLSVELRTDARASELDKSLARDKPGERGTVAAVVLRRRRRGAAGLVVTREETYTDGHADLGGVRYRVYKVAVLSTAGDWRVSSWAPQP